MEPRSKVRSHILNVSPYVPGKPISEVQRELGLKDVVKLASNENLFGPSPKAVEAVRRAAAEINFYPDGGCFYLRNALAAKHGVSPENVIVGNGTDEVIRVLCIALLGPGEEALFANPSFAMYRIGGMLMDASLVTVELKDYVHDLAAMREKVTDRTRMVIICNPNNPTGTIVRRRETEAFMKDLPDNVLAVFDEAYFEYVEDPEYPDSLEYFRAGRNVACLRTFSKIHGLAGLRVGYGIVTEDLRDALDRVRNPFNVNQVAQEAALAALEDTEHVEKARAFNSAGKKQLFAGFRQLGLAAAPSEANFILVDVGRDSQEVFQALLKKGVIVRPGRFLGFPTHLRVTIGSEKDNKLCLAAFKEVLGK